MVGRRMFAGVGLAAALLLGGCQTTASMTADQTAKLTTAATAVGAAADGLALAAQNGVLKGQDAATAKTLIDGAAASVHAADTARIAGKQADATANVATSATLLSQLVQLILKGSKP